MLARRALLAVPLPLAVAACAGGIQPNTVQVIAKVSSDVQLVAKSLSKSLTQIAALDMPGLTPAVLDTCQTALAGLQTVAKALASVTTVADAQPLVAQVSAYAMAFIGALTTLPLPKDIKTALTAVAILLPVIELTIGLAISRASSASMTAEQARVALK